MAFTYNADLTDKTSQVRQYVGDTDEKDAQVQDATILAYLTNLSPLKAASRIAYDLSAKYTRLAIVNRFDDQETDYSKVAQAYKDLGKMLDTREDVTPGQQNASAPVVQGIVVTGGLRAGFMPSGWA